MACEKENSLTSFGLISKEQFERLTDQVRVPIESQKESGNLITNDPERAKRSLLDFSD
jgi:hypothetical protein